MLGGWEILDKPEKVKVKVKKEKKKLKNGERMLGGWEILDKTEKKEPENTKQIQKRAVNKTLGARNRQWLKNPHHYSHS